MSFKIKRQGERARGRIMTFTFDSVVFDVGDCEILQFQDCSAVLGVTLRKLRN